MPPVAGFIKLPGGYGRRVRCGTFYKECSCLNRNCKSDFGSYVGKLKHTDFVMMVAISETSCSNQTMAYASHCSTHPVTKRPLSGYVNICPAAYDRMKTNEMSQWLATIKHELIHAFVFSPTHFKKFPGAGNATSDGLITVIPGVLEKFTRPDWEIAGGTITHTVYMITTPKVREEVRKYFNCPTLEGAEIESQGGSGTAGSHWEKRVLENEAMTGVSTQVYALSRITLALFEDSGWYQVNYDKAENMTWGKGLGCDFAKKSCLSWMLSDKGSYPFCTTQGDMTCNANRKSKVYCNLVESSGMPEEYNYNKKRLYKDRKGTQILGSGGEALADFCPYYRVFGELAHEDRDTRCTYAGNMNQKNYSLEIFSKTARCFSIDGGFKIRKKFQITSYYLKAGCYEAVCRDGRLHVKVQNSKFYPCYFSGQLIHIEKYIFRVGTVKTKIICPPCEDVCSNCQPDKYTKEKIGDYRGSFPGFTIIPLVAFMIASLL